MADITKKIEHRREPARPQAREYTPSPWWNRWRDLMDWDPFGEMRSVWPERGMEGFNPNFEVRETNDAYIFRADLPGVSEEDIDINLTGNRLTIGGKREAEQRDQDDKYYCYECSYGSFSRSFTLPEGIKTDDVRAEMKNGVLTLHVPKAPEAQPRRIKIGGAEGQTKHKA